MASAEELQRKLNETQAMMGASFAESGLQKPQFLGPALLETQNNKTVVGIFIDKGQKYPMGENELANLVERSPPHSTKMYLDALERVHGAMQHPESLQRITNVNDYAITIAPPARGGTVPAGPGPAP